MGSLVPQTGGGAVALANGFNPFLEAARGISDGAYLKFNGNKGDITFGSDDEDLPEGSQIVVDMSTLALGWICWDNSQVVEEILVDVVTGKKPPMEHELTDHGPFADEDDGWREAASVQAVLYAYGQDPTDEAVGTKLLFKTSTGGQVRSLKKLAGQYGKLFMQHQGELPIVELGVESYMPKVKKHGKKYSLLLKIVGWVDEGHAEALAAGGGDNEDDYDREDRVVTEKTQTRQVAQRAEVEEPAPRSRRQAAPAEEVEETPAPRRGRGAAPVEAEPEVVDETPAPRGRGRGAAPAAEPMDEDAAPAPRRRGQAAAPADDAGDDDVAPAPRGRGAAPAPADEDEGDVAPAPRGRSPGRGAPPTNARLRNFN